MSTQSFNLSNALEKMTNRDKDFRFMAASDLLTELAKDTFKLDADGEKRLVEMLLKLVEDNSGDVRGMVVKCFTALAPRLREQQITSICNKLTDFTVAEKPPKATSEDRTEELREVAATSLEKMIEAVQTKDGQLVVRACSARLSTALQSETSSNEVKGQTLATMRDLLARFGGLMAADHERIQSAVLPYLGKGRPEIRKRAIACLGHLSVTESDKLFNQLVEQLLAGSTAAPAGATKAAAADTLRAYIQCIGAISKSAGYRLSRFIARVAPLIANYIDGKEFDKEDDDVRDDLRENCFQTFESLVLRCPKEVTPYLDTIRDLSLKYIKHDPNYVQDDEEEGGGGGGDDEDEDEDDGDYSADDDVSWKVRRASTKCLAAIVSTRPELLETNYVKVAPTLVSRFREREETVRTDIFAAFVDLLRQTSSASRRLSGSSAAAAAAAAAGGVATTTTSTSAAVVDDGNKNSPLQLLRGLVPTIVSSLSKALKTKSARTRSGALVLLREVAVVLPDGAFSANVKDLVPGLVFTLNEKGSNTAVKVEALSLLRVVLETHAAPAVQPHVATLAPPLFKCVQNAYYKIAAEALRACSELTRVLRPAAGTPGADFDFKPYVKDLYAATLEKLKVLEIDQEVKESAITCMGHVIALLGDELQAQLPETLKVFQDRLGNEITRLPAVRALARIAASPRHLDLGAALPDIVRELSTFLRKTDRQIKQASLIALETIVSHYGATDKAVAAQFSSSVLIELVPLLNDADLNLANLALRLVSAVLQASTEAGAAVVQEKLYERILALVQSSLLQGVALQSLLNVYAALVRINAKKFGFDELLESLLALQKQAKQLSGIANAVATLVANTSEDKREATIRRFVGELGGALPNLPLLCLGEIGRRVDLGAQAGQLQQAVTAAFESQNEETKQAASFALGSLAVGNLSAFLPFILTQIAEQPKRQYLLLHSLREVIARSSHSPELVRALLPHTATLIPMLFKHTESADEGTRNVVAECLGRLSLIVPDELLPQLVAALASPAPAARAAVVGALKFQIVEQPHAVDRQLQTVMPNYLALLTDADLNVRLSALRALNYAAHNKPSLIRALLPDVLPTLYGETVVKKELIREVDLGPFKHKVDDGLELRKAGFECMYTLLDRCLDRLDLAVFITRLVDGLKDHYDIKLLAILMLIRLATSAGAALVESLDNLVEPLRAIITAKAREGAVQQEVERNDELVRQALRAVATINKLENIENNAKFADLLKTVKSAPELNDKFEAIRAELTGEESRAASVAGGRESLKASRG